ncbi:hypothetical protein PG993_014675 [Apiospora rasikravindrae]|uniref:DUF1772-domain-containing protein n=1 Tax=Apiospora rasikravindrae TaxID=990691 RepID=A0ABR1RNF5_9PEZI
MQTSSTSETLIASTNILSSAVIAGATASLSAFAVPAVLNTGASTDVMLRQWFSIFHRGKLIPIAAVATGLSHVAVSYGRWAAGRQWRGFALGGALTAALIPFTVALVMPTNRELAAAEAHGSSKKSRMSDDKVRQLIRSWRDRNVIRCFLPLAGAGFALWNLIV